MTRGAHDLELFQACFARNNPRARTLDSLRWQYLANTTPHLFVDLAVPQNEDRVAAIYASLPGWMQVRGERRLAQQSLDTLTDVDFRGKGLFITLAQQTFARAASQGSALIYGFPNGNSAHGFFKKLGWVSLDPVPFLLRPLRLSYAADRLKLPKALGALVPRMPLVAPFGRHRRKGVRELSAADPRMTQLWNRFSERIGIAVDRDDAYLQWRVYDRPDGDYRTLVFENEDGSALRAMCVFTLKEKHGGRIGYLMELLHDRTVGGMRAASHLLGLAVREMSDAGADSVLGWSLPHSPNYPIYVRHAFFPLPKRLRPVELHFGVRAFDRSIASTAEQRSAWYLSYLDADTV
jgi:hypothetical protein